MEMNLTFPSGAVLEVHQKWLGFGATKRLDFYEVLRVLLENRGGLRDSISKIYDMASRNGAKVRDPYCMCLASLLGELDAGMPFDQAIRPLVPLNEAQLIRAGLKTGDLVGALSECIRSLERGNAIFGAVAIALLFPSGMLGMIYYVMGIFSKKVIPPFEKLIPIEQWTGAAGLMAWMVETFRAFGPMIAVGVVGMAVMIAATMTIDWGAANRVRVFLDAHVPPWSIYRMTQGTAFLKTLASQIRAGQRLDSILQEMAANTSPWLRTRLDAISDGLARGLPLGEALHEAGYQFPDRRAVDILRVLSESDGFDKAIAAFAERWENTTVKKVQAASKISIAVSTLGIGLITGTLFLGIQELQDQVEANASSVGARY